MKKLAIALFLCLGAVTMSLADVWDDAPASSGWDTPAPASKVEPQKAKKEQPKASSDWDTPSSQTSSGWDTPAPAPKAEPKKVKKEQPKASSGWDTPAPKAEPKKAEPKPAPAPVAKDTVKSAPAPTPVPVAVEDSSATSADSAAKVPADSLKTAEPVATSKDSNQVAASEATKPMKENNASSGSGIKVHWVPVSICAGVAVLGGIMAAVFDSKAKDVTSGTPDPKDPDGYKKAFDDAGTYQTLRAVSIGLAAAGLVGIGVTFMF